MDNIIILSIDCFILSCICSQVCNQYNINKSKMTDKKPAINTPTCIHDYYIADHVTWVVINPDIYYSLTIATILLAGRVMADIACRCHGEPFAEGRFRYAYKGRWAEKSPKLGQRCVVKKFKDTFTWESSGWNNTILMYKKALIGVVLMAIVGYYLIVQGCYALGN